MDSARGARSVRLARTRAGLGFSIKGGKEHGIPVVVSWIQAGGAAASVLQLGDEILAVDGKALHGLTHAEAVGRLTSGGRGTVTLRIKPNHTLADVFSAEESNSVTLSKAEPSFAEGGTSKVDLQPPATAGSGGVKVCSGPLPVGWVEKVDMKTGRSYFENQHTETTTWTDPRLLEATPLTLFEWNKLPPGWERFLDDQGDIYYVNHDTQSTHWDSPRGLRQQTQLREVSEFLSQRKMQLQVAEKELQEKREVVLIKNRELDKIAAIPLTVISDSGEGGEGGEEEEDTSADLIDDIMLLNEEVELQDSHMTVTRRHLKALSEILKQAQFEDLPDTDEHRTSAELALQLAAEFTHLKQIEQKLRQLVSSLEALRSELEPSATPLPYLLQLPPPQQDSRGEWLHTLPDRLTGKTNCEMRLELSILRESCEYGSWLEGRLAALGGGVARSLRGGRWEELGQIDFLPLQLHWLQASFREKLEKLFSFD